MRRPKRGDVVICLFPEDGPPWKTVVIRSEKRYPDGWIALVEPRPPCECCGRKYYNHSYRAMEWFEEVQK